MAVALGGTSIAASFLPADSVGTAQLQEQSVTNTRIGDGAVGTLKLRGGAVTTQKIRNGTIEAVDLNWALWREITSTTGQPGPQGVAGAAGAAGAPGAAGAAGPAGAQGPAGPSGGRTIISGAGAPSAAVGIDGDFYIDTAANAIYGPKSLGGWPSPPTSMIGPTGPAGPAGATGPAGPDGAPGSPGPTGPAGPDGATGPAGPGIAPSYGAVLSTSSQPISTANTATVIAVDTRDATVSTSDVTLAGSGQTSRICVGSGGIYNMQFSAQVLKTGGGTDTLDIWPRAGTWNAGATPPLPDLPLSDTQVSLGANSPEVAAWNWFVPLAADDCVQIAASSSDGTANIIFRTAQTGPTRPAVPGIIITLTRIG